MEKEHVKNRSCCSFWGSCEQTYSGSLGKISDEDAYQSYASAAKRSDTGIIQVSLAVLVSNSLFLGGTVPNSIQGTEW